MSRPRPHLGLAVLSLLLVLPGCVDTPRLDTENDPGVDLTILHLNDLHARLLPDSEGNGGFANVASVLERERAAATAHLTLHGGDMVQGTPVSTLFKGAPIFEVANLLKLDVHCLGNHEFDYGWEKIPEYVELSNFDTVSANLTDTAGKTLVPPYVVRQVGDLRIAVVGAITEKLLELLQSNSLGPWRAAPLVATLQPVVALAAAEADMVVVLGHLSGGEAETILENLPEVSVVVQGHPHRAWKEALEIDGRIAVSASGYGRDVGRLRLRYDRQNRRILQYDWEVLGVVAAELRPDPAVRELVEGWEARASELVDHPIGWATRTVDGEDLRTLIERIMRDATDADLAHMNRGGVRDVLPEGELRARHVWNIEPFSNRVLTTEVSGKQLIAMHRTVLRSEPLEGFESLNPDRTYRLATIDFRAGQWRDRGIDLEWTDSGSLLRDLIIAWINTRESVP